MAVKIKGIEEISALFPKDDAISINARLISYKWYKVVQVVKLTGYIISSLVGVMQVLAAILIN